MLQSLAVIIIFYLVCRLEGFVEVLWLEVSGLNCFFISQYLSIKVLLIGGGVAVEVAALIVVIFLTIKESSRALSYPLEAIESGDVSVRVDVHVLDCWRLNNIQELLLVISYFLVVHLQLLLVFLDAHSDAVDEHIGVDSLL